MQGEDGFSKDDSESISIRLKAHLSDVNIKNYQEPWAIEEILDNCIAEIENEIPFVKGINYNIQHFYNFSINPFDQDIFFQIAKDYSQAQTQQINYRASGLEKDPFEKMHNRFARNKKTQERRRGLAYMIIRYVLFRASEGREREAEKKDIFPGFKVF